MLYIKWYGVTKVFVTFSNTNTLQQKRELRAALSEAPLWSQVLGRGHWSNHWNPVVSTRMAGPNSLVNVFRFALDCTKELCESGVTAVWPGMLHRADSDGASQSVPFAGPLRTNVHCCPICELTEAPSLPPSHSRRVLLWPREPLEGKQTGCTTRLHAPPQTLPISCDTCCLDPRSDVSASCQPQVPMTPLV